jgi:hypothetical protein
MVGPTAAPNAAQLAYTATGPDYSRAYGGYFSDASLEAPSAASRDYSIKADVLTAVAGDAAWTNATYQNGWATYNTGSDLKYRKMADGMVTLRGEVKNGTAGAVIATLPAGYRPAYRLAAACKATFTANTFRDLTIGSDGTITPDAGASNAYVAVNMTFYADA